MLPTSRFIHTDFMLNVKANLLFRLGTTLWLLRKSVKVNLRAFLTSEPDETQSSPLQSGPLNYQKKMAPGIFWTGECTSLIFSLDIRTKIKVADRTTNSAQSVYWVILVHSRQKVWPHNEVSTSHNHETSVCLFYGPTRHDGNRTRLFGPHAR